MSFHQNTGDDRLLTQEDDSLRQRKTQLTGTHNMAAQNHLHLTAEVGSFSQQDPTQSLINLDGSGMAVLQGSNATH